MQELQQLVASMPYLRPDSPTTTPLISSDDPRATESEAGNLVIQDDSDENRILPMWGILTLVGAFLLVVVIIGIVMLCIRRRHFSREVVRSQTPLVLF